MTSENVAKAAVRLSGNSDYHIMTEHWKETRLELVLSMANEKEIMATLAQYHTVNDFADFVKVIAEETRRGGR